MGISYRIQLCNPHTEVFEDVLSLNELAPIQKFQL